MRKLAGISLFLLLLYVALLMSHEGARGAENHFRLQQRIGMYGVLSLAAGLLIIAGGIDLSIGSVVGLCVTLLAMLVHDFQINLLLSAAVVIMVGAGIGLFNGILVTRVGVQPFIATLAGLFIFRGLTRQIANEETRGLENEYADLREFLNGEIFGFSPYLLIFLVLAAAAVVFLHFSVYGRYFYAIGSNERAARFSGISTVRFRMIAYVLCSALSAVFAILFLMKFNSAQPSSTGGSFELYAIAGAVLGGCSLRGGEGSVLGIIVGTAIIQVLPNMVNMWGISSQLEETVIGAALLMGAILDELLRPRQRS